MSFKKAYNGEKGYTPICKIGECSLKKLEFGIIRLDAGETVDYNTEDKETAFIVLEGHCDVIYEGGKFENVGNRSSVFENSFFITISGFISFLSSMLIRKPERSVASRISLTSRSIPLLIISLAFLIMFSTEDE